MIIRYISIGLFNVEDQYYVGDNKIDYNAPKADIDSSSKIYSNHIELSNINSIASTKNDNSSGAESFDALYIELASYSLVVEFSKIGLGIGYATK